MEQPGSALSGQLLSRFPWAALWSHVVLPSSADAPGAEAEHRTVWHIQGQQDVLGWIRGNFCKYLSA